MLFLSVLPICARNKRTHKHKRVLRSTVSATQQKRKQAVRLLAQQFTTSILAIIVNWAPFFLANSLMSTSHLLSCDPNWLQGNAMMSAEVGEVRVVHMHVRPNDGSAAAPNIGVRGRARGYALQEHRPTAFPPRNNAATGYALPCPARSPTSFAVLSRCVW